MEEGSTGAGKFPQGCSEVGVGRGVIVEVGIAVGVAVGGNGMKGVAVEVAFGSAVTSGPTDADPSGMIAPGTQLQDARIAQKTKSSFLAINFDVNRFISDTIVIILIKRSLAWLCSRPSAAYDS
jgi:hypothetical protein